LNDVFGNRIEKAVDPDGDGPAAAVVRRYVLDGWNNSKPTPIGNEHFDIYAELDGTNQQIARHLHGDGFDQTFARVTYGEPGVSTPGFLPEVHWQLTDHLNSVRMVLDTHLRLPLHSQLVQTARQTPLLVAHGPEIDPHHRQQLQQAGVECLPLPLQSGRVCVLALLDELGRRQMTNLLVEGGGQVLGSFLDSGEVDEVRVFVSPMLIGGNHAPTPIAGEGISRLADVFRLHTFQTQTIGTDVLITGRLRTFPA